MPFLFFLTKCNLAGLYEDMKHGVLAPETEHATKPLRDHLRGAYTLAEPHIRCISNNTRRSVLSSLFLSLDHFMPVLPSRWLQRGKMVFRKPIKFTFRSSKPRRKQRGFAQHWACSKDQGSFLICPVSSWSLSKL